MAARLLIQSSSGRIYAGSLLPFLRTQRIFWGGCGVYMGRDASAALHILWFGQSQWALSAPPD
jgi:hypothetical protein